MRKAVIFDFDYTLGDSTDGIVQCANYGLEQLGLPAKTREEIRKTIGMSLPDTLFALTGRSDPEEVARFSQAFHEKGDHVMVASTELYGGVKEILQDLKREGCRLGIVTTKRHFRMDHILSKTGITGLIDLLVGAEDVKVEKPDPEGLLRAVERLRLEKSEVLYVGDSLIDARTAENAGVDFAGVLTGTTPAEEFSAYPNVFIGETIADIYRFITSE